jgi:hypothetical protein
MRPSASIAVAALMMLLPANATFADISIVAEHNDNDHANAGFKFKNVPPPSRHNAATKARFAIVDGEPDDNGGGLDKLHDGEVPSEPDEPAGNFFFNAGTDGGRILVDLGGVRELKQVNTYSWHPGTRGPQVYHLYASDGKAAEFNAQPKRGTAPEKCGWRLLAQVDTRPKEGDVGGQYGVSISDTEGTIGKYRYLLFDISRTEADDDFGNTFYSEIDVVDHNDNTAGTDAALEPNAAPFIIRSPDGYCEISIDIAGAPELREWAEQKLAPVLAEWYPKIVALLPSEGYSAPTQFSVTIKPGRGVASTGGRRITVNSTWLKRELAGEGIGALIHEEVHVVQQYRSRRRNNPESKPVPAWLTEGIPDYIRWFLYEPQSHGADAVFFRTRRNTKFNYDGLYRVSANFLNYAVENYGKGKHLIARLSATCRQGKYTDDLWKELTGKTLPELNDEWKAALRKQLGDGSVDTHGHTS